MRLIDYLLEQGFDVVRQDGPVGLRCDLWITVREGAVGLTNGQSRIFSTVDEGNASVCFGETSHMIWHFAQLVSAPPIWLPHKIATKFRESIVPPRPRSVPHFVPSTVIDWVRKRNGPPIIIPDAAPKLDDVRKPIAQTSVRPRAVNVGLGRDEWRWLAKRPMSSVATPIDDLERADFQRILTQTLARLSPREERVIRLRFGIGIDGSRTLAAIGDQFGISKNRIRQIEVKALRKLKHPSRSALLKPFLNAPGVCSA